MNQQILAQKQETVAKLNELFKNSKTAVIVSYSGLPVSEINSLRNKLREVGCSLTVQKNTLLKKAVAEEGLSQLNDCLKGPTALVYCDQEGAGLSVLSDFKLAHNKQFSIKGGFIGGTYCDEAKLALIAPIGTKENALSCLLSALQSPLVRFGLTLKALAEKASA